MAIVRWDPWSDLTHLHRTMDNIFSDAFISRRESSDRNGPPVNYLPVDVKETKDGYVVKAPVPGIKPEDVEVTFSDGLLSIRAGYREESEQKEGTYLRREVASGGYFRQIALPGKVNPEKIKADVEEGILMVKIPREQKPEPLKIPVGQSKKQLSA
ncbi:MAG: Hsp20/alpha crystallin family protein [Candidatus Dormibacteraceae bacterium]